VAQYTVQEQKSMWLGSIPDNRNNFLIHPIQPSTAVRKISLGSITRLIVYVKDVCVGLYIKSLSQHPAWLSTDSLILILLINLKPTSAYNEALSLST
jgi:hypothetical protein